MSIATINHSDAINLFKQMLSKDSKFRILRLCGGAKLGKSHLVAKVFPKLAEVHNIPCVIVDLRNKTQTIPQILDLISKKFGGANSFRSFYDVYQDWMKPKKIVVTATKLIFSKLSINLPESTEKDIFYLTTQFIEDLSKLNSTHLLIFDTVNDANDITLKWLIDIFLTRLESFPYIRVLVAGRSVPEVSGTCALICHDCELKPVRIKEEYVRYCKNTGLDLKESDIEAIARASRYTPGLFYDYLSAYLLEDFNP